MFVNDWCTLAHAGWIAPLVRVATTFQQHRRGILNWWLSQISNGLIEGINSLIQAAIAKAGVTGTPESHLHCLPHRRQSRPQQHPETDPTTYMRRR